MEYLLTAPERVAFLFARPRDRDEVHQVEHLRLLAPQDYLRRTRHGVELADHVRPEVIRAAHQQENAVVEAHAHGWPGHETGFSRTDLDGLQDLGPHMTWRLPARPYTALVFGPDSYDALVWQPDGSVTGLDALVVDGAPLAPTGRSLAALAGHTPRRVS